MLISDSYQALNRSLHESDAAYGTSGAHWAMAVSVWAARLGCRNLLDYGAGKRKLEAALADSGLKLRAYDPAVPEIAMRPDPADMVACCDVLEHVEPECVEPVLDDLRRLARKGVFLSIAMVPAKKTLADGRNAHLSIHDLPWWLERIEARWDVLAVHDLKHQACIVGRRQ